MNCVKLTYVWLRFGDVFCFIFISVVEYFFVVLGWAINKFTSSVYLDFVLAFKLLTANESPLLASNNKMVHQ